MKKHVFDSLTDFYTDIKNDSKSPCYDHSINRNDKSWVGLSYDELQKYKFSYPVGVAELKHFKEANQFDGFDIDVDRMYEHTDFILDERKLKKLPKSIDIFVNVAESCNVNYRSMLNKTYTATKIIDHLESLGVRCALYAVIAIKIERINTGVDRDPTVIEVCIKNHHDNLNLGAVCASISPWMLRYFGASWIYGKLSNVREGAGYPTSIPKESLTPNCIVIDTNQCMDLYEANEFIEKIKIVA